MIEQKAEEQGSSADSNSATTNLPDWAKSAPKPKQQPKPKKTEQDELNQVTQATAEEVKAAIHESVNGPGSSTPAA